MTYIYILKCPTTQEVRYVGRSREPKRRYYSHLNEQKTASYYKKNWIKKLGKQGLKPILEIIKEVPTEEASHWEQYFIDFYREQGCNLTNLGDGSRGCKYGNQTSFKKGNISWRTGKKLIREQRCEFCNEIFFAKRKGIRFCSNSCAGKKTGFKKGNKPWTYGKKGQERLFNSGPSKPILQIDKNTGEILNEFPSAAEAMRQTGISDDTILVNLGGRTKTAGGFIWRRK
jgi:predicted GIY-YIG superfamily endonuclease